MRLLAHICVPVDIYMEGRPDNDTKHMQHIVKELGELYISKECMQDLGILPTSFPLPPENPKEETMAIVTSSTVTADNIQKEGCQLAPCGCPVKSSPPDPQTGTPIPSHRGKCGENERFHYPTVFIINNECLLSPTPPARPSLKVFPKARGYTNSCSHTCHSPYPLGKRNQTAADVPLAPTTPPALPQMAESPISQSVHLAARSPPSNQIMVMPPILPTVTETSCCIRGST
jgi:hypothetical protein